MLSQAADNPAMLKLMLALEGVDVVGGAGHTATSGARPTAVELLLNGDICAYARVNPASSIRLSEREDGAILSDSGAEVAVRIAAQPEFASGRSARGVILGEIAQVRGSYAIVMLGGGCGLSVPGRACAFCLGRELTEKAGELWPIDGVVEAVRGAFGEGAAEFVQFHLGYFPGDDAGLYMLRPYLDAIHRHFDTMVAVTMHPPAAPRVIDLTYAAGVDVVAYNLEAADEESMRRHFPGRARFFGRKRYLEALRRAARVFPSGAVWSEILIDLAPIAAAAAAIDELTAIGVTPMLGVSALEPCHRITIAQAAPLFARLHNAATAAGLSATWARDISAAITPLEARYFVPGAPQLPVFLHQLTRNRLGALTTRSLARLRRRLRVKRVRASFDASHL
ncbi:MAG: hypothetical protein ACREQN_05690 [Candidatus Binataceae bacterium]